MKNLMQLIFICLLFSSCANPFIYQLSSVKSDDVPLNDKHTFVYEDSLFTITYNFWSKGGTMSFKIFNKTNAPIYIDWNKSNFIRNGKSADYWEDIATTKGSGVTYSTGYKIWYTTPYTINSNSYNSSASSFISVTLKDKPNNQIPPHAYLEIDRFDIYTAFVLLPKYPKKNDSIVMKYDSSNSMMSFRNFIAYTKNQDLSNVKFIDNSFWVDKITCINNDRYNDGYDYTYGGSFNGVDNFSKERYMPNSFYTVDYLSDIPDPNATPEQMSGVKRKKQE